MYLLVSFHFDKRCKCNELKVICLCKNLNVPILRLCHFWGGFMQNYCEKNVVPRNSGWRNVKVWITQSYSIKPITVIGEFQVLTCPNDYDCAPYSLYSALLLTRAHRVWVPFGTHPIEVYTPGTSLACQWSGSRCPGPSCDCSPAR
jgi:hypothetical protein